MPTLPTALAGSTGYLLSRTGQLGERAFGQALTALDLRPRAFATLTALEELAPCSQQRIADALGLDRSDVAAEFDELARRGFVDRRPHPADRRAYEVKLSAPGLRLIRRAWQTVGAMEDEFFAALTEDERRTLHDLLTRVANGS